MNENTREQLNDYITTLYGAEDGVLQHIQAETTRNNMPEISLAAHEGRLLQFLAEMVGAKLIVEIGTLAGYSGTWLARALPEGGKLITLEVSSKHAAVARNNFEEAGLSAKVDLREGQAGELLDNVSAEGPFDMVFIDADKPSYPDYLEWAIENVRPGGIITAHNALQGGGILNPQNSSAHGMAKFNERLAQDSRLSSMIFNVGDGMAVGIKKG